MRDARRRARERQPLQRAQAFVIVEAPDEHHRQRQQEIAERHFEHPAVQRRPQEQPELQAEQPRARRERQREPPARERAREQLAQRGPAAAQRDDRERAGRGPYDPPRENVEARQRREQLRIRGQQREQRRCRDRQRDPARRLRIVTRARQCCWKRSKRLSVRCSSNVTSVTCAAGGPCRSHASILSICGAEPCSIASTEPSSRFATQPRSFSACASRTVACRKPTPCTTPRTRT
ncbi:hypothetical protein DM53_4526 [Burkholderia mallei]|nr:hypothetical protein DM53_4526 [Burkholderia mallei]